MIFMRSIINIILSILTYFIGISVVAGFIRLLIGLDFIPDTQFICVRFFFGTLLGLTRRIYFIHER